MRGFSGLESGGGVEGWGGVYLEDVDAGFELGAADYDVNAEVRELRVWGGGGWLGEGCEG